MIFADSRYSTGKIFTAHDARKDDYFVTVLRKFPTDATNYFLYSWAESDRMDIVASRFLGSASRWWRIMDFNPEIINAFDVPLGTTIRIPYE